MPTSNPFLRGRFPRPTGKAAKRPTGKAAKRPIRNTAPAESKWIDLVEIDPETGVVRNKVTPGVVKPLKARKMPRLKYRGV